MNTKKGASSASPSNKDDDLITTTQKLDSLEID
jgi:hypothetical protein